MIYDVEVVYYTSGRKNKYDRMIILQVPHISGLVEDAAMMNTGHINGRGIGFNQSGEGRGGIALIRSSIET